MSTEDERTKLYNEVWSEPVTIVAKRYGISDNGLRKRCINLQIPLPPLGYWAKVRAGAKVPKPELPVLKVKEETIVLKNMKHEHEMEFIDISAQPIEELKKLDGLGVFTPRSREAFARWCEKIHVPKKVDPFHPLIIEYQKEIEYRKVRDKEHRFRDMFQFRDVAFYPKVKYRPDQLVLPIHVSDRQHNRACRIVDTLIKAVEELGGKVKVESHYPQREAADNAIISLFKNSFSFQMKEMMAKRRVVIASTLPEDRAHEFKPMCEKIFTGKLEIEFKRTPEYWEKNNAERVIALADSAEASLEEQLGEAFKWMVKTAQEAKIAWVIQNREEELRERERERQRTIEEERQKKLQAILAMEKRQKQLVENVEPQMTGWFKAQKLRQYADEIETYAKQVVNPEEKEALDRYIQLVRRKAEKSDPIAEIVQEIKAISVKAELP
ncbi:hypothetical protein [Sporomusa termitida]|uniref:Uncharacterized protein n=1 Tax=Sporomusa termitida TaxID=2377 RepID=A0A517DVM1_9FIRM|nr:hypothetical protein [Sporomusa termitida]QDR81316.1 hypothetical protein SPTER_26940 [Sporomusa termitida]